jgi:Flp pilus assembly pilin Flp
MTKVFTTRAKAFLKSDDGPTATHYALMLAPVIVVVIVSVADFGDKMSTS